MSDNVSWVLQNKKIALALSAAAFGAVTLAYMLKRGRKSEEAPTRE